MTDRPLILLVDDEPDILVALQDLLEDRYDIIALTSPIEALARLSAEPDVALIVSDQRMPELTGDQFLARARALTDANAILLTGYADLSAVTSALNSGGIVGYAPKPWEPDALRAMIAGAVERHQLRRELRLHQALLTGLMDNIPAAIAFKDTEGQFLAVNRRKAEQLAVPADTVRGKTEIDLGGAAETEPEQRARATGSIVIDVVELESDAGSSWIETDYIPTSGDVANLIIIERDITAQKMAESQLRQADKLRALGTLAGGVAHDFNNLLTAILGSLELAARRFPDEQRVLRYIDNATLAARRGAALTQRLLGFSRQTDSRPCAVDVAATLQGMDDLIARTLGGSASVAWRLPTDLWQASVESDQLELALLNLCVNARDAMVDGGVITVEARNVSFDAQTTTGDMAAGDYVAITVADTGEGMRPEVLARVLEPFFTTKPVGKGTGLGLPMAYGFAQRSGGALDIESEVGVGTRVTIYLPRVEEEEPCPADDISSPVAALSRTQNPRVILVVDDEDAVRRVTSGLLRDFGHEVFEANGGSQALDLVDGGLKPDLVLVDFAMPGMSGVDLIQRLEAKQRDLPAILLTGYADVDSVPTSLSVMTKPFSSTELLAAVEKISAPAQT